VSLNLTHFFDLYLCSLNGTSNWTSDPKSASYNATKGDKPSPQIVITNEEESPSGSSSGSAPHSSSTSGSTSVLMTQGQQSLPLLAAGLAIVAGIFF
jgi:hypothetical protein